MKCNQKGGGFAIQRGIVVCVCVCLYFCKLLGSLQFSFYNYNKQIIICHLTKGQSIKLIKGFLKLLFKSRIFRNPRIKIRRGGQRIGKIHEGKKVCCRVAGAENCCKRWHASPHNLLYTHKHGSSDPTHTIFVDFFFGGRTDGCG